MYESISTSTFRAEYAIHGSVDTCLLDSLMGGADDEAQNVGIGRFLHLSKEMDALALEVGLVINHDSQVIWVDEG